MSAEHNEDSAGETLEEAGALEADVGANFDQQLAGIDPKLQITMDPFAHRDLRPEMMFIREELRQAKWQTLADGGSAAEHGTIFYVGLRKATSFCNLESTLEAVVLLNNCEKVIIVDFSVRRTALKKLLLKDFMQEDCELRNIGLAYAPPDP